MRDGHPLRAGAVQSDEVPAVGPRGAGRWALASFLLRQVRVSKLSDKAAERVRVAVIYAVLFIYFLDYLFIYSL